MFSTEPTKEAVRKHAGNIMTFVAGVGSSTQSVKIVVCDLDTGDVVRTAWAPHPVGTQGERDRLVERLPRNISPLGLTPSRGHTFRRLVPSEGGARVVPG